MFRKLISFVLALSIFSVSAMASSQTGLKAALEEFNYAITVEWDQKDGSFLNAKKEELAKAIAASGLSQAELVDFAKSQINDASIARDLDSVLAAVSAHKMTLDEAEAHMVRAFENSHMNGASWSGGLRLSPAGVFVLVLAIFVILGNN